MSNDQVLDLWRGALTTTLSVAAPFLIAGLIAGLAVAIFQTATQLQESVLAFVPKLGVALLVIALGGHWILDRLGKFTQESFTAQSQPHQDITPVGPDEAP